MTFKAAPTQTEQREGLRQLWLHMERKRAEVDAVTLAAAMKVPAIAQLVAQIPQEMQQQQRLLTDELQRLALVDGDWQPLLDSRRAQGMAYANMGIAFSDWFELLSSFRRALLGELWLSGGAELVVIANALAHFLDRSMAAIGDGYLERMAALVHESEQREAAGVREAQQQLARHAEELERSNRELNDFAYVASHDLKAPLQDLHNLATWIVDDLGKDLPAPTARHIALLQDRIARMDKLLEDLLDYSRAGRVLQPQQAFSLKQALDDALALVPKPQGFTIEIKGPLPNLRTPKAPLTQILRNLIGNAIKHHDKPSGTVVVEISERDTDIEIAVSDDGPGIAPQYHERVFRIFQTLKPRDEVEGSGMGLAIVQKVVEAHGATVRLASEGRGTTFRFTWPKVWPMQGDV